MYWNKCFGTCAGGGGGGRGGRGSRRDRHQEEYFSDDDSLAETGSVLSSASEKLSVHDDEADERTQLELLEEKLKEAIDLTSQKSSHGRTTAFETLCKVRAPFPSMTCSKTAQSLFE